MSGLPFASGIPGARHPWPKSCLLPRAVRTVGLRMSYLHCPVCSRAYNVARQPSCPYCPVIARPVDPAGDIVAAAEALGRALAQATPAERAAAAACMDRFALPVPDAQPAECRDAMLRSSDHALAQVPWRSAPRRTPRLATIAFAVLDRIASYAPERLLRAVQPRIKAFRRGGYRAA